MPIRSFQDLLVWQRSMQLAQDAYPMIRRLPADERFELCAQMRRAVVSTPSNIAEGFGYGSTRRYVHHLRIALGSNAEFLTHLMPAERLQLVSADETKPLIDHASQIGRMLNALIQSLQRYERGSLAP